MGEYLWQTGSEMQRLINSKKKNLYPYDLCLLAAHHNKKNSSWANVKDLKNMCNEDGIKYFIVNQMTEAVKEHCS